MYKGLLLLVFMFLFQACDQSQEARPDLPEEQQVFTATLNGFCNEGQAARNQEKWNKNYTEFESWINSFSDSIAFVHNWKGQIKDIRLYDAPAYNSTSIGFEIQLPLKDDRNISLYYKKLIPYGHEYENLIFHQLRSMEETMTVNFDGILKKDNHGRIAFGGEFGTWDKKDYNLCEPHLQIEITSLKPEDTFDSESLEMAKKLLVKELKSNKPGLDNKSLAFGHNKEVRIQREKMIENLSAMDLEELRYLALAFSEPKTKYSN